MLVAHSYKGLFKGVIPRIGLGIWQTTFMVLIACFGVEWTVIISPVLLLDVVIYLEKALKHYR